jgi:XTP/dITP diphosphohydrolase
VADQAATSAGGSARRVVLATRNAHKVAELSRILAGSGAGVSLVGLDEFPDAPDVPETGLTFADNALLKARAIAAHTGLPAVADDSGLCVDALHGMPGVLSARWSGKHGDDQANLDLVLGQLEDITQRGAQFICAAALVLPAPPADPTPTPADPTPTPDISEISGVRERTVTGVLSGTLARAPRGSNGFGYDPIFIPDGEQRTTAELAPTEKDAISHRGRAFRALAPLIAEALS